MTRIQTGRARGHRVVAWLAAIATCASVLAGPVTARAAAHADTVSPAAPLAHAGPPVTHPCHEGRILCGRIRVPLYWSLPDGGGRSLVVRFRVYPHTDAGAAAAEPLVGFEGGPGYGSMGSAGSYLALLGPLHADHDLIVMDQRGTGRSDPIRCRALQHGEGSWVAAVAACARHLGDAANAYGSAAAAEDLHAILHGLGIAAVDLYGDSYGTYLAQAYALHHPEDVRAMVLDGAFDDAFDPFERPAAAALRHSWSAACARVGQCPGILTRIAQQTRDFARHPLVGTARDADGALVHVRVTARDFAQLVGDGTYVYTVLRDLPAAMAALRRGDRAPMLRLAAEHVTADASGGSPAAYSYGDYMAVSCHDYPTAWDTRGTVAERRAELRTAIRGLDPEAFAPFPNQVWLHSLYESQLVYGCLRWPRPTISDPALPAGPRPDVPVLVTNGEFDQATPAADARKVARHWPNATFVVVRNTEHITALADFQGCASGYVRRFLQTLDAGDTSCARAMPPVNVVSRFPVRLRGAPMASPDGAGDESTGDDRRAAWVATQTLGDALSRWYNAMYGTKGHGMRGGSYTTAGAYYGYAPLTIDFHDTRFVRDLAVRGTMMWNRRSYVAHATLRVTGPAGLEGAIDVTFPTNATGAVAHVRGTIDGHTVRLALPAPWAPQG
jgi:pimeloyl-ACP methyl ester carboxylesterase